MGYTGSQGIIGYSGSAGYWGSVGYTGSQGIIGYTGSVGPQGPQGFSGSVGYTGSVGPQGPQGYSGSVGYSGSAGPSNVINASSTATGLFYPVMVSTIGSNQTAYADTGMYFDAASNALYLTGDLYVDGTQTVINSTSITTGDKTLTFSTASTTAALALNSGIQVGTYASPYASFLFDGTANWVVGGSAATGLKAANVTVSGLTTGRVVYPGTGGLLSGSANFFFDAANNNLTINDTGIQYSSKLYVNGSIASRNGGVDGTYADAFLAGYTGNYNEKNIIQTAVSSGGTGSGFRFKVSDGGGLATTTTALDLTRSQILLYTAGTERTRIDAIGNVGIGFTPNTWYTTFKALQFGANGSSIFGRSENNTTGMASNAYINASGAWTYINTNYASYYQQLNGQHQWFIAPSGTGGAATTFTTALTLDNSGNLGINTTPNSWYSNRTAIQFGNSVGTVVGNNQLDIGSNFYSQVTTSNDVAIATGYSTRYRMADPSTGSHSWWVTSASTTAGNAIGGFSQAMTLDRTGNLGIGTSSPSGAAGLALAINGGAAQTRIALKNTTTGDAAGNGFQIVLDAGGLDVGIEQRSNASIRFTTNNTERLRITANGGVAFGGAANYGTAGQYLQSNGDAAPTWGPVSATSATNVAITNTNALTAPQFITFVSTSSGYTGIETSAPTGLIYIPSSGNFGLGTSAPTDTSFYGGKTADIYGPVYARQNGNSAYYTAIGANSGLSILSAGGATTQQLFYVAGTEKMRIDNSGNVVIGATSAGEKLDIQSSGDLKARVYTSGALVTTHAGLTLKTGSYEYLIQNFTTTAGSAGALRFYDITAATERARIDASGNFGIGNAAPGYKLEVTAAGGGYATAVALQSDIGGGISITSNSSGANSRVGLIFRGSDNIGAAIASAREDTGATWKTYMAFYTNNLTGANTLGLQEKMRIDSAGNLGIGSASPTAKLDVTDGTVNVLKAKQITVTGAPNQGTYAGYLLLAKAYTSGNVTSSSVIGRFYLKRGGTSSGNRVDIYDVSSNSAYQTEDLSVQVTSNLGQFFSRTVKVTYNSIVYHAIETSVSGGIPDNGVWFNGTYVNCDPIYVDATSVSSITAYSGALTFLYSNGNLGIATASPSYKLDVAGSVRSTAVALLGTGVAQGSPSATDITANATLLLSGNGGNYLSFGQSSTGPQAQWIQSAYTNPTTATYPISLNPLGGNVGIATLAPAAKLHVIGTESRFGGVASGYISIYDNSGRVGYIQANGGTDLRIAAEGASSPMTFYVNGSERVRMDTSGNFLVGTTASSGRLTLVTAETKGQNATPMVIATSTLGANDFQLIVARGTNTYYSIQAVEQGVAYRSLSLQPNGGNVGVGTTTPGYLLQVAGSFAATTKSFVIDHPTKPGYDLRYGSLEGPENGVYVRGKLKGSNKIELPDYWAKLVDPDSITVSLTSIGKHQNLYVADISDNVITIGNGNLLNKAINCYYVVYGERCDVDKLVVEIQKPIL